MKALVLVEYGRLEIDDVPEPGIGPEEVLVRVRACGICGSDVHGIDGSTGRRRPPIIMGHEAAGVVARRGADVGRWAVGDRVTFDSTVYCGHCSYCLAGRINLCAGRRVLGVSCEEYRQNGAFAEYVAVPARILHRLPDALSFEHAALSEPLSVALHGVRRARVAPDDSVAVVGTGMVGLLVVQVLRAIGCRQIIAVDLDTGRLELARKLGADVALCPADLDVPAEIARRTGGRGADVAIEVVGIPQTVQMAVRAVCKGGRLCLIGNLSPAVELPLQAVVAGELSLYGSCASCGDYPAGLEMMSDGRIDAEAVISTVAPLAEGAAWLRRLSEGERGLLKVILCP